jgi:hypothetical protein
MIAAGTPFSPSARTCSITSLAGTVMIAISTGPGIAATVG